MKERTKPLLIIWTVCCVMMILITYDHDLLKDLTFEGVQVTNRHSNVKETSAIVANTGEDSSERVNHYDQKELDKPDVVQHVAFPQQTVTIRKSSEQLIQAPQQGGSTAVEMPSFGKTCDDDTRLSLLRETCDVMDLTDDEILWKRLGGYMWVVDHVHKVFYCMIPKTATHSLRYLLASSVLGRLDENMLYPIHNYLNRTGFRFLHKVSEQERDLVLRDYFKMMVVRHPMDRLRSAYNNKMKEPGGLNAQVLNRNVPFIEKYLRARGKLSKSATFDPMNDTLTFQEFLELVSIDDDAFYDEHWRTAYKTCRPCTIKYDAVMRVETLDNDIRVLYDLLESQGHHNPGIAHENVDKDRRPDQKMALATEAFDKITPATVSGIMKVYEKDLKLFGYHWDKKTGATCGIQDESGSSCC